MNEVPGDAGYDPGKFSKGLPDEKFDDLYVAKAISVVRQKELEAILKRAFEDEKIADNMRDYWKCKADGAE